MFQCLDVFMKLNHSLLEPHLELIWTMLWKAEKSGGVSYNCLLSCLISTYVKLRQVSSVFPFKTLFRSIVNQRYVILSHDMLCNVTLRRVIFNAFNVTVIYSNVLLTQCNDQSKYTCWKVLETRVSRLWRFLFCEEYYHQHFLLFHALKDFALRNLFKKIKLVS